MKLTKDLLMSELVKKYGGVSAFASSEFGYKLVENKRRNGSDNVNEQSVRTSYLASFIAMARKGFYSYDSAHSGDSAYVLICGPKEPVEIGIQLLEADGEVLFENEDKSFFLVNSRY